MQLNTVSRFPVALIAGSLLALIWSVLWRPFWGLEYEDAFVYSDSASFMLHHYPWTQDPFKTKSIVSGSLLQVRAIGTYGGHSEAFPLLIAGIRSLTSSGATSALIINAVLSSIVLIMIVVRVASENREAALPIALLWLGAPTLILYQTTGFSEISSSLLVMIFLRAIEVTYLQSTSERRRLSPLALIVLAAAIATKRENLLLVAAFPMIFMLAPHVRGRRGFWISAVFAATIAVCYAIFFKVSGIEANEGLAISATTFSWSHFRLNAPALGEALLRPDFWGLLGCTVVLSPLFLKKPGAVPRYWFYAIFFFMYFMLYCMHYRSIFQVRDGAVQAVEMLRYSINFFPCAVGMLSAVSYPRTLISSQFRLFSYFLVPFLILWGLSIREQFSKIEDEVRFLPARHALALVRPNEPIITDTPMCARLIASASQDIRDTGYFLRSMVAGRDISLQSFLLVHEQSTNLGAAKFSELTTYRQIVLEDTDGYRLSRFERK